MEEKRPKSAVLHKSPSVVSTPSISINYGESNSLSEKKSYTIPPPDLRRSPSTFSSVSSVSYLSSPVKRVYNSPIQTHSSLISSFPQTTSGEAKSVTSHGEITIDTRFVDRPTSARQTSRFALVSPHGSPSYLGSSTFDGKQVKPKLSTSHSFAGTSYGTTARFPLLNSSSACQVTGKAVTNPPRSSTDNSQESHNTIGSTGATLTRSKTFSGPISNVSS
ncbi:uncharacterized protein MONOS_5959 [Monocercomonoides exilis]|uniref:uncharacterized protein n=1 Tax=Monocercomonoides exilis TaxID=2049356 RepID=UPI00355A4317|nr:hypothetical protein MONOS_5959 [Monocercomonoides exilis]|eukprot:MONOS_5959.1-p1 / transcript=MONOS_5959.1 / gene=MONOS_5959 / organism=Monocercomonoides_exilis_PA203 / gene_product=unspecified product / transcript_product=unspecified product / location=Mono_scaffold00180:72904-73563(-) / protein_length=220 / sequence_SO=supercontig / SO=protein_coding / is_pseudo=false